MNQMPILEVMNANTLRAILRVRGLNQSALAKMTGVSRQTVSHWFQQKAPEINVHSKNLQKVALCLGVKTDKLSRPFPLLEIGEARTSLETNLLWDRLYPDIESFIAALLRRQPAALARLVQVYGLFQSEKTVGSIVWKKFPQYKLKIAPAQRRQVETIWNLLNYQD